MSKPTILITGQHGQLGNELKVLSHLHPQLDYVFTGAGELDISNEEMVNDFFYQYKPTICINAAAYTAVDKAETEKESALKINGDAVGYLAANCTKYNTRFIHVSTDYVFDGHANVPYTEDHPVNPVNFYGLSKLRGEELALTNCASSIVIRTSWVYSSFGNNFVKTMIRLMQERESISVVADQFGSPTYAADLAEAIMQIALKKEAAGGIYHYSNKGNISWFDFAIAISELAALTCEIKPINTLGYPTPAKRPAYSVMSKERIEALGITVKDWKESLRKCMRLLIK